MIHSPIDKDGNIRYIEVVKWAILFAFLSVSLERLVTYLSSSNTTLLLSVVGGLPILVGFACVQLLLLVIVDIREFLEGLKKLSVRLTGFLKYLLSPEQSVNTVFNSYRRPIIESIYRKLFVIRC